MQHPPQWHNTAPPPRPSSSKNVVLIVLLVFVGACMFFCAGGAFIVWRSGAGDTVSCYNLTANGEYQRAIPACRAAVEKNPNSGELHNELSWCLTLVGQLPEGLTEARKAVELEPNRAHYDSLAMALALSGQGKEAMKAETEHVLYNGDVLTDEERVTLGMVYYANGQHAKAHEEWQKAMRSPDDADRKLASELIAEHP